MNQNKRVVFTGLARDCAHALQPILQAVEQLGSRCEDWGYVFLENNSVDRTSRCLHQFDQVHRRGTVRSLGNLDTEIPLRTQRLARLRNLCLETIFADRRLSAFDFLVVMDLDGVNEQIDAGRLLHLMDRRIPRWTAFFANQRNRYYDIWALRHRTWCPEDCWKQVRLRPASMSFDDAESLYVSKRQIRLDPRSGFVPVESAFGGLGLYRLQLLRECRYVGIDGDGHQICEHVAFHADCLKQGGRLYIDTALLNGSGDRSHDSGMDLLTRWKRSFEKKRERRKRQNG